MENFFAPRGWLEVIVGGMYSGKTEELIRRLRRWQFAKQKVQIFKPRIDNRYSEDSLASHNQNKIEATVIDRAEEILLHLTSDTKVIGIDEGQFFDASLVSVVNTLASQGVRVIVAGLDTDWRGNPFEPMPTLMAIAESVTKHHAVCMVCGGLASRTQRIFNSESRVAVGSYGMYEARCREHFTVASENTSQALQLN